MTDRAEAAARSAAVILAPELARTCRPRSKLPCTPGKTVTSGRASTTRSPSHRSPATAPVMFGQVTDGGGRR